MSQKCDDDIDDDLMDNSENDKVIALEEIALQHSFVGRFVFFYSLLLFFVLYTIITITLYYFSLNLRYFTVFRK